ncbi:hypothetical protein Tco_0194495 [Tanacetum coccineum]
MTCSKRNMYDMFQEKHEQLASVGAKYVGAKHDRFTSGILHASSIHHFIADVPEILLQQFWKILDILSKKREDFTEVQNDEDTLTFLVDLGYSGPLHKYTNMFMDHMHQPWRTLAACINKYENNLQEFILYSTGHIYIQEKAGKGSQGKKTADPTEESVDVSDESEPEPLIRRKTSSRRVAKKKATISVDDNIVPEPDIALELGKSISLTEAEEEAAARQVHATHARIVSESVLEPARRRRSDIAISETTQKLKGIQTLTLAEQEAADVMKALKDSRRMLGRQPGTGGSDEGTGEIPGVPDESIFADAEDDNEETESDSDDIYKYRINVRKNADTEMKDAEKTADITKETTEQPLTSSSFSVPSDYGNQFLNLSHNEEIFEQPPVLQQTTPIPTTITTPPINTMRQHSPTNRFQKITPFIVLSTKSRKFRTRYVEYLGTKLDDALLKTLERHTADLVEKYSVLPAPETKKRRNKSPTYTIKSTDKAALEEFDLKSALFKSMHKNKSANRNPANYILYHALMEALIEDENAMDKEVADTVKDHNKESNDARIRESGSAKKPSTTKESSKGKDPKVGSKTGKSATAKEPVEEPTDKKSSAMSNLECPTFMMVKGFHENNISLQFQMEECHKLLTNQIDLVNPDGHRIVPNISNPLPLGGPPGQVTIQPQFFFNKDLEYLLTGDKERNRALSISKLKAALYPDFGLEELVPSLWIKQFYINKHSEPSDRDAVRSHMRILSVISIKTYERYGYNYLREIVLRRADYNEYKISEKDFKSLHPNDFEDLNILHIQGKLDHLPKQDKVNLHNAVSLWTRNIVIRKRVEDLQLGIESYQTKG